ncbi:unnamed protein product [Linum tenue]|uniref:Uncharacterized protein n=1 Tax=Linum tenue TaxID=586396 RepID=A0AAV0MMX8_9ROSI|nr:unnamed protein product [Linum tenue]
MPCILDHLKLCILPHMPLHPVGKLHRKNLIFLSPDDQCRLRNLGNVGEPPSFGNSFQQIFLLFREFPTHRLDEIGEQARWKQTHRRRPEKSITHKLPQLIGTLRDQNLRRFLQIRNAEDPILFQILLLHTNPGAADHHSVHRVPELGRHAVAHEPAVAEPDDAELADRTGLPLQGPHQGPGLETLGPVGSGREGVAEEDEVGNVEVEVRDEVADDVPPLPESVGAEAVDEEEVGLCRVGRFGYPAVDYGAVLEVRDGGSEPRGGEG